MTTRRRVSTWIVTALLFAAICMPALGQMLLYHNVALDDPFITYRYAANFIAGHGLVWNAGEPPVEGYTTFLWVMLNAAGLAMGVHPLWFSKMMGLASVLGLVLLPLLPVNPMSRSLLGRVLVSLLLSMSPLIPFYGMSGMEHVLFTLVSFTACLLYLRWLQDRAVAAPLHLASAALGLAALIRPEGIGLFGIMILFEGYRLVRAREASVAGLVRTAWPFLLTWAPYYLWRFSYYGYPFPNTFYAKHTGGGLSQLTLGAEYLSMGFRTYLVAPLSFSLAPLAARLLHRREPRETSLAEGRRLGFQYLVLYTVCFCCYVFLVGGDDVSAFPSARLFLPVLPITYLMCAACLEETLAGRPVAAGATGAALVILAGLASFGDVVSFLKASVATQYSYTTRSEGNLLASAISSRADIYEEPELSRWIREQTPPGSLVAMPWAGRFSYYCDRPVLDTLGLNDRYLSHLPKRQRGIDVKMDANYVVSRKPELIIINVNRSATKGEITFEAGGGWKLGDRELIDLLKRSSDYTLDETAPGELTAFRRRASTAGTR